VNAAGSLSWAPIVLRRGTALWAIAHANDAGARARVRILLTRQN